MALGMAATGVVAIGVLGRNSVNGNVWGPGGAPPSLMYGTVLAIIVMFWAYAKAKGHPGWLGVVLPLLNVVGLVVLLKLKDRHPHTSDSPDGSGVSSSKAWATYIFMLVGLAVLAYVVFAIKGGGV
jgi:hypothetical protein